MNLKIVSFLIAVAVIMAISAGTSFATIYTYVDDDGVVHFSNVPTDPQYKPVVREKRPRLSATTSNSRVLIPATAADWDPDPDYYDEMIRAAANRYHVDPRLVKSVIRAESNFNYLAVSRRGALGLMQLMPGTADDMQVFDPFDPKDNINGGTRYLRKMLGLFNGNVRLALAAYNAGPNKVIELGRVPKF
ncbi:MAG: transglycosylase SLT domain-containing protein, partial [Thermodesulfobacteriota bacterium]